MMMVGSLPAIVCMHIQEWYILRACSFMANGLWIPSITRASPVYRSDGAWVKGRGVDWRGLVDRNRVDTARTRGGRHCMEPERKKKLVRRLAAGWRSTRIFRGKIIKPLIYSLYRRYCPVGQVLMSYIICFVQPARRSDYWGK
jgi:hypothetical protein